ncbi:hypothetical protein DDZ18_04285 [Marinicauda salina]|uniref:Uncharacterized protein n=1 Tax=Marinicauda salina TaxID=2135793 RepID=A0A2U2BXS5_9PROT|nr:hypothetical protein [Marinicauda salina]PWE18815.1 hypothetical protein DDZ18_04285 [Marinicauda salina]
MRLIFTILGIVLGAASLASLVQRLLDVGLAPLSREVIEYYRWFMNEIVRTWLFDWWVYVFDWTVAQWHLDVFALWVLAFGAIFRVYMYGRNKLDFEEIGYLIIFLATAPFAFLIILVMPMYTLMKNRKQFEKEHARIEESVGRELPYDAEFFMANERRSAWLGMAALLATPVGTAAFFIWNAVQLAP